MQGAACGLPPDHPGADRGEPSLRVGTDDAENLCEFIRSKLQVAEDKGG